jgi:diacylglycerol kinase family enzyme
MIIGDPENVDAQYRTEFSVKALTDAGVQVNELFAQRGDWDQAKGQELAEKKGRGIDYTGVAVRGLLGGFKRVNATVTVDGVTKRYKKVWLAPALNGRYFGGGMMIAPDQDRNSELLTSVVFYGAGFLRTLTIFPKIFTGGHLKYKKYITVLTGKKITVTFDEPRDLNLDGEVIPNVTTYTAEKVAAPVPAGERM